MNGIAFILHGKISKRSKIETQIRDVFGAETTLLVTEYAGHASKLTSSALEKGAEKIICVGGDGSLNEVVNGIMSVMNSGLLSQQQAENLRIGILPKGTGNDFARNAKIPFDLQFLKSLVTQDSYKTIDLGFINCQNSDRKEISRYFVNIADIGIGGVIAQKLESSSKFWGPTLTYQKSLVAGFLTYRRGTVQVKADTFNYEGKVLAFIVANGKYFGAGMGIAPYAEVDDGKFAVVIPGEISLWDYVKNLDKIKKCLPINHPGLHYYTASQIQVKSLQDAMPIDMDGEFLGFTPVNFTLITRALKFLWPS